MEPQRIEKSDNELTERNTRYRERKSRRTIPVIIIFLIVISITIFKLNIFSIEEVTFNINLYPRLKDVDGITDTKKIDVDNPVVYSDLIFQTTVDKNRFVFNQDVVYSFTMDEPPPNLGERFDDINIHEKGTIEIWMEPSWAGDDNAAHYFVDIGENPQKNRMTFFKDKDNFLKFRIIDKERNIFLSKKYVGESINEAGLKWKDNNWYRLASTWDLQKGELSLYVDNAMVDYKKFGRIFFDNLKAKKFLLGNGLETLNDPNWGKTNCAEFNKECEFKLDEFILWKNQRQMTQLLGGQLIAQYVSQVMDLGKQMKFLSLTLDNDIANRATLLVHTRSSNDGIEWSDWNLVTEENGEFPIGNPNGRFFQIEIAFTALEPDVHISLNDINKLGLTVSNS